MHSTLRRWFCVLLLTMLAASPAAAQEQLQMDETVVIQKQPASAAVIVGGKDVVFSVSAEHVTHYQWQYHQDGEWKDLIGATEKKLICSAVKGNNGKSYRCALTGEDGAIVYTKSAKLQVVSVGGTISFGKYEQDNDTGNGKEAIQWKVLAIQGKKALLISQYVLDAQPFHTNQKTNKWEKCSLRKWLNQSFLKNAFSKKQQKAILTTTVDNGKSQSNWKIDGGKNTKDKVFLLSYTEAWKYFKKGQDRRCKATAYAQARGVHLYHGVCDVYWLRSPANTAIRAATVYEDGGGMVQVEVNDKQVGVRPAIWVSLNADMN